MFREGRFKERALEDVREPAVYDKNLSSSRRERAMMTRMTLSLVVLVAVLVAPGPSFAEESVNEREICFTQQELNHLKEVRTSLAAKSPCDTCIDIAAFIIGKVGCGAGEAVLDIACTAAEIVFFEADEIIAPICTGLEVGLGALCAEFGAKWIAEHTREAGKMICQNIAMCPK